MYHVLRIFLATLLRWIYRVEVHGIEHFKSAGPRVLIVANHTSLLDALLLSLFLPDRLTFAIDTHHAQRWYGRLAHLFVDLFPMNLLNPLSTKSLIKYLKGDRKAVIFPEGRLTRTGALMKIYQGPGLIAERSEAMVLPVRIEGAQYTSFSRLKGRVRIRWFLKITLTLLPPRRLLVDKELSARERRGRVGAILSDLMTVVGKVDHTCACSSRWPVHCVGGGCTLDYASTGRKTESRAGTAAFCENGAAIVVYTEGALLYFRC